jgi:hypothetical protein
MLIGTRGRCLTQALIYDFNTLFYCLKRLDTVKKTVNQYLLESVVPCQ